jgi:hypothetical protein
MTEDSRHGCGPIILLSAWAWIIAVIYWIVRR